MRTACTLDVVSARTGACAAFVLLLAGCAGGQEDAGNAFSDPGMGHVHGLGVGPASGDVYGWDSVTGSLLRSADGGRFWSAGKTSDGVADLAVLSGSGDLLATRADGPLVRTDGGKGFDRYDPEPSTMLTQLQRRPGTPQPFVGVGVDGEVRSLTDGSWERSGAVGPAVTAFTVPPDGSMPAATDSAILVATDQGQTWQPRAPLDAGSS